MTVCITIIYCEGDRIVKFVVRNKVAIADLYTAVQNQLCKRAQRYIVND